MPRAESGRAPAAPATRPGWEIAEDSLVLGEGSLHVWRAELDRVGEWAAGLLVPEERERAERLLDGRDRALWIRSRGVLRDLLGRYLGEDPVTLRITTGPQGKPALPGLRPAPGERPAGGKDARISFNLSHSDSLALYAFAPGVAVGVDVEVARRPLDVPALAGRLLGPAEAARLAALEPADREDQFRSAWVRHEAALKCPGVGIGGRSEVDLGELWIAELDVGPGAAAAVAAERAPEMLRRLDWNASSPLTGRQTR